MQTRPLTPGDRPALEQLLLREPTHNQFHLSALAEYGFGNAPDPQGLPWAIGAFRGVQLSGVFMDLRGTGVFYQVPEGQVRLEAMAEEGAARATKGKLSLLNGHASQIDPLLPLIEKVGVGQDDYCYF